jgi:hypothetical protein
VRLKRNFGGWEGNLKKTEEPKLFFLGESERGTV